MRYRPSSVSAARSAATSSSSAATRSSSGSRASTGRGDIAPADVVDLAAEQLRVALLLLAGPPFEAHRQLALDQPLEGLLHLRQGGERVQPVGALLQLARRLRTAEHEHAEDRDLVVCEPERLLHELPVLDRAAPLTRREPRPFLAPEPLERIADHLLVVVDDGVAVRRLVAGEAQRVERQRIGVGRRPLLLDQAAEHPDLDGVCIHGHSLDRAAASLLRHDPGPTGRVRA